MVSDNGNNKSEPPVERKFLTPDLAAQYIGVNTDTVYGWINSRRLKATDIVDGSRTRWHIRVTDLDDFMDGLSNQVNRSSTPTKRKPKKRYVFMTEDAPPKKESPIGRRKKQ